MLLKLFWYDITMLVLLELHRIVDLQFDNICATTKDYEAL